MHTMLERQRLTRKRLSNNRDKLKEYCGQLNLERIPENPTPPSPRDQAQILLHSYRSQNYDAAVSKAATHHRYIQMQQSSAFQIGGRDSSILMTGCGSIDPSPKLTKRQIRSRENTAEEIIERMREKKMREMMGISLPSMLQLDIKSTNTLQDVVGAIAEDTDESLAQVPDDLEKQRKKVKLQSNPVMIRNFKYSPR